MRDKKRFAILVVFILAMGLTLNADTCTERADPNFKGKFTRMGRIVFDSEYGRTWVNYLQIEMGAYEVDTE